MTVSGPESALRFLVPATLAVVLIVPSLVTAQPETDDITKDYSGELPRIKPVPPEEALATFTVQPGFRLELAAAEPLVVDPVALSFDEDGRLFVAEMRDYSEQANDRLGAIRLLTDENGDGRFDRSTVYADDLSWPTAVLAYEGGIFVGAAPDLLYLKDTDQNGVADMRRVVFTGFRRDNVQGLVNSLAWGIDNRVHGAASSSGAAVRRADRPDDAAVSLAGRDFSFDPRTLDFRAESGGAQHGMSFDPWGRKFVCSNSDHLQLVLFEDRYFARNPYFPAPPSRRSIAADGPQAEVYRTSPVEPWRIVRTRLRLAGVVPGPVEGGGRAAGYFTSATGLTIYKGDLWPDADSLAIVGDVGGNLIHRKRLSADGLFLKGERIDEGCEFVSSNDVWFRPVQFANGPDGSLVVADMYREVIEHPLSLPEVIKKHLDLTSGRDRGRIYRIVPETYERRRVPRLSQATPAALVAALGEANAWHRETAARLLFEKMPAAAVGPLREAVVQAESPLARMHALAALDAMDRLTVEVMLAALKDADARVRCRAVRTAERAAVGMPEVKRRMLEMCDDVDPQVRFQLAFSLGELPDADRMDSLARLAVRDGEEPMVRSAIQSSLADGASEFAVRLAAEGEWCSTPAGAAMFEALAAQVGRRNHPDETAALIQVVSSLGEGGERAAQSIVAGLATGAGPSGRTMEQLLAPGGSSRAAEILREMIEQARERAGDAGLPAADRVAAIRTLGLGRFEDSASLWPVFLGASSPAEVQLAALSSLGRFDSPEVAGLLIRNWPTFSPRMRTAAAEVLCSRSSRLEMILKAVEDSVIQPAELEPARVKALVSGAGDEQKRRAEELLVRVSPSRQGVLDARQKVLAMAGDVERGRAAFRRVCATCHKLEGVGAELGPNLATVQNRGPEATLLAILDPNREVNPQYVSYVAVTESGRTVTGMVTSETATSLTLTRAEGASDTVLRGELAELFASGTSLMPEGLENQLDDQSLADLLSYLASLR
jgi:putative membrane-bound dehydrogenase-like protein